MADTEIHREILARIEKLEKKTENLEAFRNWAVGAAAVVVWLVTVYAREFKLSLDKVFAGR